MKTADQVFEAVATEFVGMTQFEGIKVLSYLLAALTKQIPAADQAEWSQFVNAAVQAALIIGQGGTDDVTH